MGGGVNAVQIRFQALPVIPAQAGPCADAHWTSGGRPEGRATASNPASFTFPSGIKSVGDVLSALELPGSALLGGSLFGAPLHVRIDVARERH
jgi:hypothetical protein